MRHRLQQAVGERLVELLQRPGGCDAYRLALIAKGLFQRLHGLFAPDLAEGPRCRSADSSIGIVKRRHERSYPVSVADLAQGSDCRDNHAGRTAPISDHVYERINHCILADGSQRFGRLRLNALIFIVERRGESRECFGGSKLAQGLSGVPAHDPGGIGERGYERRHRGRVSYGAERLSGPPAHQMLVIRQRAQ